MATKRGSSLTPRTGYNPKTSSRSFMQSKPTAKTVNTSVQAERQIKQPPQPFQNKMGAAKTQPSTHPQYRSTGNPKELSYKTSNRYSVHNGTSMPDDML